MADADVDLFDVTLPLATAHKPVDAALQAAPSSLLQAIDQTPPRSRSAEPFAMSNHLLQLRLEEGLKNVVHSPSAKINAPRPFASSNKVRRSPPPGALQFTYAAAVADVDQQSRAQQDFDDGLDVAAQPSRSTLDLGLVPHDSLAAIRSEALLIESQQYDLFASTAQVADDHGIDIDAGVASSKDGVSDLAVPKVEPGEASPHGSEVTRALSISARSEDDPAVTRMARTGLHTAVPLVYAAPDDVTVLAEVASLRAQLATSEGSRRAADAKALALAGEKAELIGAQAAQAEEIALLQAKLGEYEQLAVDVEETLAEHEQMTQRVQKLEKERIAHAAEAAMLTDERKAAKHKERKLRNEVICRKQEGVWNDLQADIAADRVQADIIGFKADVIDLELRLGNAESDNTALEAALDTVKRQLIDSERLCKQLDRDLRQVRADQSAEQAGILQTRTEERNIIRQEVQSLREEHHAVQESLRAAHAQIARLEADIEARPAEDSLQQLTSDRNAAEKQLKKLQKAHDRLQAQVDTSQQQLEDVQQELKDTQASYRQSQRDLQAAKEDKARLQEMLDMRDRAQRAFGSASPQRPSDTQTKAGKRKREPDFPELEGLPSQPPLSDSASDAASSPPAKPKAKAADPQRRTSNMARKQSTQTAARRRAQQETSSSEDDEDERAARRQAKRARKAKEAAAEQPQTSKKTVKSELQPSTKSSASTASVTTTTKKKVMLSTKTPVWSNFGLGGAESGILGLPATLSPIKYR